MGTFYGPRSPLPAYLTKTLICPGTRAPIPDGGFTWKGCRGGLKTWYEGAEDRTVWECSRCGDRNIAKGRADDPLREKKAARPSSGKKRDSQRQAIYDWEEKVCGPYPSVLLGKASQLPLDQCQEIINQVWTDYGLTDPPKVHDGRGSKRATGSKTRVKLPGWCRVQSIVLHEVAHSLQEVPEIWPDKKVNGPWHGPPFATLVLDLYRRYLGIDHVKARRAGIHQRPRRVRFAKMDQIPKPVRKTKRLKIGEQK